MSICIGTDYPSKSRRSGAVSGIWAILDKRHRSSPFWGSFFYNGIDVVRLSENQEWKERMKDEMGRPCSQKVV